MKALFSGKSIMSVSKSYYGWDAASADHYTEWFEETFPAELKELAEGYPNETRSLCADFKTIEERDADLAQDLLEKPVKLLENFEKLVADTSYFSSVRSDNPENEPIDVDVRIGGLPEARTFYPGQFRPSSFVGEYIAVKGEIKKATEFEPELRRAEYECTLCGTINTEYSFGIDQAPEPHKCSGCDRKGPFRLNDEDSDWRDRQRARVKTPADQRESSGASIDVLLQDDAAGSVEVGDRVTISGIVRVRESGDRWEHYLEAKHVFHERSQRVDIDISEEERSKIEEYAADDDYMGIVTQSLQPRIFGYDHIKQALILAAVGGSHIDADVGTDDRGMIHVLMLGDPGTAKSKLGKALADIAPRSVSTDSFETTPAGLSTAAVRDDEFGEGGWTIEAGAFVRANDGVLWIDELDDLPEETIAGMATPMASGEISVSKSGQNASFAARASVIAAANPKHGRFDEFDEMSGQFDFPANILSRFDLMFTLKDKPDKDRDKRIARTMLEGHDAEARKSNGHTPPSTDGERFKPFVEHELLRKWIALAREQGPVPFDSEEVREQLEDDFVTMRDKYHEDTGKIPLTFRDIDSVRRLAQAAARLEFNDTIERRHLDIALELFRKSMSDTRKDADGEFDADTIETGQPRAQKNRIEIITSTIKKLQDESYSGSVNTTDLEEELPEDAVKRLTTDLENLKDKGEVYSPEEGFIRYINTP